MMADAADRPVEFNSILLVDLVELQAAEAAEPIERAFAANRIDVAMVGNWERVRQELGVVGLGLSMPKNPHNSLGLLTDVRPEPVGINQERPSLIAAVYPSRLAGRA